MAGIGKDGSTPQERQTKRKRPWRDYRVQFVTPSAHRTKEVTMLIYGPNAGEHFAGVYTLDELVEVATDILNEVQRRKINN